MGRTNMRKRLRYYCLIIFMPYFIQIHFLISADLEVLQWARANGCDWDASTCSYAAEAGDLEMLKWARVSDTLRPFMFNVLF